MYLSPFFVYLLPFSSSLCRCATFSCTTATRQMVLLLHFKISFSFAIATQQTVLLLYFKIYLFFLLPLSSFVGFFYESNLWSIVFYTYSFLLNWVCTRVQEVNCVTTTVSKNKTMLDLIECIQYHVVNM